MKLDFEEAGLYQPLMIDLDRDEALRMFNAGETELDYHLSKTDCGAGTDGDGKRTGALSDGERGCGTDQDVGKMDAGVSTDKVAERGKNFFWGQKQYGIYQIVEGSPGREYEFMDLNFIERHGYQVKKEDYELIDSDKNALWRYVGFSV